MLLYNLSMVPLCLSLGQDNIIDFDSVALQITSFSCKIEPLLIIFSQNVLHPYNINATHLTISNIRTINDSVLHIFMVDSTQNRYWTGNISKSLSSQMVGDYFDELARRAKKYRKKIHELEGSYIYKFPNISINYCKNEINKKIFQINSAGEPEIPEPIYYAPIPSSIFRPNLTQTRKILDDLFETNRLKQLDFQSIEWALAFYVFQHFGNQFIKTQDTRINQVQFDTLIEKSISYIQQNETILKSLGIQYTYFDLLGPTYVNYISKGLADIKNKNYHMINQIFRQYAVERMISVSGYRKLEKADDISPEFAFAEIVTFGQEDGYLFAVPKYETHRVFEFCLKSFSQQVCQKYQKINVTEYVNNRVDERIFTAMFAADLHTPIKATERGNTTIADLKAELKNMSTRFARIINNKSVDELFTHIDIQASIFHHSYNQCQDFQYHRHMRACFFANVLQFYVVDNQLLHDCVAMVNKTYLGDLQKDVMNCIQPQEYHQYMCSHFNYTDPNCYVGQVFRLVDDVLRPGQKSFLQAYEPVLGYMMNYPIYQMRKYRNCVNKYDRGLSSSLQDHASQLCVDSLGAHRQARSRNLTAYSTNNVFNNKRWEIDISGLNQSLARRTQIQKLAVKCIRPELPFIMEYGSGSVSDDCEGIECSQKLYNLLFKLSLSAKNYTQRFYDEYGKFINESVTDDFVKMFSVGTGKGNAIFLRSINISLQNSINCTRKGSESIISVQKPLKQSINCSIIGARSMFNITVPQGVKNITVTQQLNESQLYEYKVHLSKSRFNEEILSCPDFDVKCNKQFEKKPYYVDWLELEIYGNYYKPMSEQYRFNVNHSIKIRQKSKVQWGPYFAIIISVVVAVLIRLLR